MPRARNIKPAFFMDDELHQHGAEAAILFAGLWSIADREGRLQDRPAWIRAHCMPFYNCDIDGLLDRLADGARPFIVRYEVSGERFIQIRSWAKHQRPHHKEPESEIPSIDDASSIRDQQSGINDQGSTIRDQVSAHKIEPSMDQACVKHEPSMEVSRISDAKLHATLSDWLEYKAERNESPKPKALSKLVSRVLNLTAKHGVDRVTDAVETAIANGWKGFDRPDVWDRAKPSSSASTRLERTISAGQKFLESGVGE